MNKYVIDEEFLQQIETLQILLKKNTAGMFGGNHQSKTFGSSTEFADYREYMPGDDITKIDWNAYARFDKLYLKLFLDERQVHTRIYIDASKSMEYGKGEKAEFALKIAASIAYLSIAEMDKVSIYYIQENMVHEVITDMLGKDAFYNSIGKLNDIEFKGDSFISEGILPTKVGYGDGISIILSDFLTENDYEAAIDYLVDKKRDVFAIQILDKGELKPKIRGKVHFYDCENIKKTYRKNINKDVMIAYNKALNYVMDRIRNYCNQRNANYLMICSNQSLFEIFFKSFPEMGAMK